ncbi:hypothetical protein KDL44_00770 [bacterium]|nr:hypothetical protein [bacterium]
MQETSSVLRWAIGGLLLLAVLAFLVLFLPALKAQMKYDSISRDYEDDGDRW